MVKIPTLLKPSPISLKQTSHPRINFPNLRTSFLWANPTLSRTAIPVPLPTRVARPTSGISLPWLRSPSLFPLRGLKLVGRKWTMAVMEKMGTKSRIPNPVHLPQQLEREEQEVRRWEARSGLARGKIITSAFFSQKCCLRLLLNFVLLQFTERSRTPPPWQHQ